MWPYCLFILFRSISLLCSEFSGSRVKKSDGHRIILGLSKPFGGSINYFIDKKCYSVKYFKFYGGAAFSQKAGVGALIGK